MAVDRKELIEVIKQRCNEKEERISEYKQLLFDCVCDVIREEGEHLERRTSIQKKVDDICDRLAVLVKVSSP